MKYSCMLMGWWKDCTEQKLFLKVFRKLPLRKQREFLRAEGGEGMKVRTSLDKVYSELNLSLCWFQASLPFLILWGFRYQNEIR